MVRKSYFSVSKSYEASKWWKSLLKYFLLEGASISIICGFLGHKKISFDKERHLSCILQYGRSHDHKLFSWRFWNKKNKILIRKILCFSVEESFSVVHPEGWVLIGIKFPNSFYHTNNMSFLWSIGPSARQETSAHLLHLAVSRY